MHRWSATSATALSKSVPVQRSSYIRMFRAGQRPLEEENDPQLKPRQTRARSRKVGEAPAMAIRSVPERGMSLIPSHPRPDGLRGFGAVVASGSGYGDPLARDSGCRIVLEDLLPWGELRKSTLPVALRTGISRFQTAHGDGDIKEVAQRGCPKLARGFLS